jgi:chromosome partitioning protein
MPPWGRAWTSATELTVYDVLLETATIKEARVTPNCSLSAGYDVLGANRELAGAEVELVGRGAARKTPEAALADGGRRLRLCADRLPAVS